jgi:hypothetical protein
LGDGNPNTHGDPNWTPLGGAMDNGNPNGPNYTPAFPAYTSGHAAFGAAMFQVIADFYGTNNISFSWTSDEYDGYTVDQYGFVRPEVTRYYATLSQAMYENAQSRIYLGIHWPWDRDGGLQQGTEVGNYVFQNALLPLSGPTPAVVQLPLTPQHGTFASLGDAMRGIGFEVTEWFILRAEYAAGNKPQQGQSGPAGDARRQGPGSGSLVNFHNGISSLASPGDVGVSIATALAALQQRPTADTGLPAAPAPLTQPTADATAFHMIDEAGEGWGSIQALQQRDTDW